MIASLADGALGQAPWVLVDHRFWRPVGLRLTVLGAVSRERTCPAKCHSGDVLAPEHRGWVVEPVLRHLPPGSCFHSRPGDRFGYLHPQHNSDSWRAAGRFRRQPMKRAGHMHALLLELS